MEILELKYNWDRELDGFKNHLTQLKRETTEYVKRNFQEEKKQWKAEESKSHS